MSSVTNPQITEEPLAIDHSFPDPPAVDLHHELVPSSPTSSNLTTLEYAVPEGRFVQLINSDQIPRYTKDATMRVGFTIPSLRPYNYLQIPRGDSLRRGSFNDQISLVCCKSNDIVQFNRALASYPEQDDSDQDSLQQDCSPWIPATHPDGALYFYDEERVRLSVS
jgi:hypothetical protein